MLHAGRLRASCGCRDWQSDVYCWFLAYVTLNPTRTPKASRIIAQNHYKQPKRQLFYIHLIDSRQRQFTEGASPLRGFGLRGALRLDQLHSLHVHLNGSFPK